MMTIINASAASHRRTRGKYSPIGIDLGSGRVKMLQLKQQRGRCFVHDQCHFPTPLKAAQGKHVIEPQQLLEQLRQAKHKHQWRGNRACLSMDNRTCYTRTVSLPPLKTRDLKAAVLWEAGNLFSFEIEEAVVSWMWIGTESNRGRRIDRYLIAAARKETADFYTGLVQKAGFNPVSLEMPLTALLRSINFRQPLSNTETGKHALFIDCGCNSTLLMLASVGRYCFHRVLNLGAGHFYRAIASDRKGDLKAALRLVYSRGTLAEKGLLAEASRLARGISETLAYWSDLSQNEPVNPAVLDVSGGGILIPGLTAYLHQELGLKSRLYNPVHDLAPARNEQLTGSKNGYQDTIFSAAHGLALRGWLK